ncbi:hypothetical protein EKO04_003395 [Ascochyta lentis]|uniref:Uncharacterized protein n=1 Tax=Ascochyta lentis TaxID=205686 RepID=A0A8H7MJ03_9PLEO|nr:hypothetical protein EKO04_003395 [Ascochyta lentis]
MEESNKDRRPSCLEFVSPTVLRHPVVGVKIRFLLPPVEHDWHCERYPVRGGCGVMQRNSRPESPYQRAARLRGNQHNIYSKQTTKLLRPIMSLHKLHLASIDVELVLDENTAARVVGETRLEQELDAHRQQTLLGTTVLGRLLDVYTRGLGFQGYCSMASWSDDWAFNINNINVAWSFSSEKLAASHQDWVGSQIRWWGGVSSRASCSPDRREGAAQVLLDVGSHL